MKQRKTIILLLLLMLTSCGSYEQFRHITEEFEIPSQIYRASFAETWQSLLQVVANKYDIDIQNQESGLLKTRWTDNTLELNFADAFAKSDAVKAAKFKIIINVVKGYRGSQEVSKVTVYKRQLVEEDFLQGWKEIPSDVSFP